MRISEASEKAFVSKQTIEYYIMLGMIRPLRTRDKKNRHFDEKLIRRIKLIHKLNESGYTLRDIRETYLKDK